MQFLKSAAVIGFLTFISRILGFIRDQLIAFFLGASILSDAFLVAFKIPNMFRQMFAEGAFQSAFIPLFSSIKKGSKQQRDTFINQIFSILTASLLLIILLLEIIMPAFIQIIAPGFKGEAFMLTVKLARICFPFLLFISLTTFLISILHTFKKFTMAALCPILMNLTLIASIFVLAPFMPSIAYALAYGAVLSGIIQVLFLKPFVKETGISFKFVKPKLSENIRKFFKKLFPGMFGAGIYYLNIIVGTIFASMFTGAVSWFHYATRLYQLPVGIIGVAITTALLPKLSDEINNENKKETGKSQSLAILSSLWLGIPAALGLFFLAEPIINLLFEHGAFKSSDTFITANLLKILTIGLIPLMLNRIFANLFFARKNTKTPAWIGFAGFLTNLFFLLTLTPRFNYYGIAMASVFSELVRCGIYLCLINKRNYLTHFEKFWKKTGIIIFLNILLGIIFYYINQTDIASSFMIGSAGAITTLYLLTYKILRTTQ